MTDTPTALRIRAGKFSAREFNAKRAVACLAAAGLLALAAGSCSGGRTYADEKVDEAEIDYRARHEHMLGLVMERPAVLEMQRQERERRAQRDTTTVWNSVMLRQRAYKQRQQALLRDDQAQFLRMLELQQRHTAERERQQTERWAQFVESDPPQGAAPAGPPATP